MKTICGVRKIDRFGRIWLPLSVRRIANISENDGLEILVDKDSIVMRKYEPVCIFCGGSDSIETIRDKKVCKHCLALLNAGTI